MPQQVFKQDTYEMIDKSENGAFLKIYQYTGAMSLDEIFQNTLTQRLFATEYSNAKTQHFLSFKPTFSIKPYQPQVFIENGSNVYKAPADCLKKINNSYIAYIKDTDSVEIPDLFKQMIGAYLCYENVIIRDLLPQDKLLKAKLDYLALLEQFVGQYQQIL